MAGASIVAAQAWLGRTPYQKLADGYRVARRSNPWVGADNGAAATVTLAGANPVGNTRIYDVTTVVPFGSVDSSIGYNPFGAALQVRGMYVGSGGNVGGTFHQSSCIVWMWVDALAPAFRVLGDPSNFYYGVIVDGQFIDRAGTLVATGGTNNWIVVTFSTRKRRLIGLVMQYADAIRSATVAPSETVRPAVPETTLAVWGDSLVVGTGASKAWLGYGRYLAGCFGSSCYQHGLGSQGYAVASSVGTVGLALQSIRRDAGLMTGVDAHVLAWSTNDIPFAPATVTANAVSCMRAIREAFPVGPIFVVACYPYNTGPSAAATATQAAIFSAVTQMYDADIIPVPLIGALGGDCIYGTGYAGATNGSGNSDVMVDTDQVHPTPYGHDYLGCYIADAIYDVIKDMP